MRRILVLLALIAGLGVGAAAMTAGAAGAQTGPASLSPVRDAEYRLGSGDKLRIITFGEEAMSGEFFVSASGKISFPLIGEVQAGGLSAGEFQRSLEAILKDGYLKEPKLSIEVLTYRPFYILGEVKKPGEYPYTNGLTVVKAVATAEGFTYRANTKKVFIRRANSGAEQEVPLTSLTEVSPGDTIRIAERFF